MTISDLIQVILMGLLVVVTAIYVWRTFAISKATRRQADASVKMAEEMREQRVMASRPYVLQKAICKLERISTRDGEFLVEWFSHFEIYNAGNGPAIEVKFRVLDSGGKEMPMRHEWSFLSLGEKQELRLDNVNYQTVPAKYCLVCDYQGVFSGGLRPIRYQTKLPIKIWYPAKLPIEAKSGREGEICVTAGELEFKEVSEEERIDAFRSRSKPI